MKYLKQVSETLAKTSEKHLKTIANICNIRIKTFANIHMKHMKTLEIYACNMQHLDLLLQYPDKTLATFI
jgi:hypothetical protein